MSEVTKLIIDLGNSNVKTNLGVQFSSQVVQTSVNNVDFSDAIIYEDKCYAIGQGQYDNNNIKSDKKYVEQLVLYAIACCTKSEETDIFLHLPVNQLTMKPNLIQRLQDKSFNFKVNSHSYGIPLQERTVKIGKVGVVAEAVASYYSLGDEVTEFIVMLDIGSKTINYATYTQIGENDLEKSGTLDFGIHQFYEDVISYYKEEKHKTYTLSDINKRVISKKIDIPQFLSENFVDRIKNALRGKGFMDFDDYSIKCVGGGSLVLEESLKTGFSDAIVLSDAVNRNVMGSELILEALGD